ncbi:MAG: AAA family ATPase [Pseudomonadota bacterium]
MSIITFYSYKGGVGRSLALANIASLLASRGKKVLVVDWDLEAPGIEEYFQDFRVDASGKGLLFMLYDRSYSNEQTWKLSSLDGRTSLDLLPSGRDEENYYPLLETFNQNQFFETGGGDFLESVRERWLQDYDFVLIDSRTGLSDAGGICTILLPDIIVALFTATEQSVRGVRDVIRLALGSRQRLEYERSRFPVIPVPSRMSRHNEAEYRIWMSTFADNIADLTDDWRPKGVSVKDVLEGLALHHQTDLSHGARVISEASDLGSSQIGQGYNRVATLLLSNFKDTSFLVRNKSDRTRVQPSSANTPSYDVYISVPAGSIEARWVENFFLDTFRKEFLAKTGRDAKIYFDRKELSISSPFNEQIDEALENSKFLLYFLTSRSTRSTNSDQELHRFLEAKDTSSVHVVRLGRGIVPHPLLENQISDLSDFLVTGSASSYEKTPFISALNQKIRDVAVIAVKTSQK